MLSRFFIDRPIFATVVSLVIALTGAITLLSLPVAQYPRVVPPSVIVSISSCAVTFASAARPCECDVVVSRGSQPEIPPRFGI